MRSRGRGLQLRVREIKALPAELLYKCLLVSIVFLNSIAPKLTFIGTGPISRSLPWYAQIYASCVLRILH